MRDRLERLDAAVFAWVRRSTLARVLGVLLLIVTLLALLGWYPEWQASRVAGITALEQAELKNELRRTVATVLAGIFVLFSGVVAALNLRLLQEGQVTAREGQALAAQGQITERFTRAVEQLGATHDDGSPKLELRLGAIYALERIARESATDHGPVMEILTAYVREHAPIESLQVAAQLPFLSRIRRRVNCAQIQKDEPSRLRADIQAVLTVIGRRARTHGHGETHRLNLSGSDLSGAHLVEANLAGARFMRANLRGANLRQADLTEAGLWEADLREASFLQAHLQRAEFWNARLEGASLFGAHLERANLQAAHLQRAQLNEAHLQGAYLKEAQLEGAHLMAADLREANLVRANLRGAFLIAANLQGADVLVAHLQGANLQGAKLREANLHGANLEGAHWDEGTVWPEGWVDGKPPPAPSASPEP